MRRARESRDRRRGCRRPRRRAVDLAAQRRRDDGARARADGPGGKLAAGRRRRGHRRRADRVHDALGVRRNLRGGRRLARRLTSSRPELRRRCWRATPGAETDRGWTSPPTSTPTPPTRSASSPARRKRAAICAFCAQRPRILRDAADAFHPRPEAQSVQPGRRASGCSSCRRADRRSRRSRRCGGRSARIFAIPGCDSCLRATPPIAARRRTARPRR